MTQSSTGEVEAVVARRRTERIERIRHAFHSLPYSARKQALESLTDAAHQVTYALEASSRGQIELGLEEFLFAIAHRGLTSGAEAANAFIRTLLAPSGPREESSGDGSIDGTGTYEKGDPGWLDCVYEWLTHRYVEVPFGGEPITVEMGARASLALLGNWGTGNFHGRVPGPAPSLQIARHLETTLTPGYTVHLGGVYYAGTLEWQPRNFISHFPAGRYGSFALNSNHEMYAGNSPYYNQTLLHARFSRQQRRRCFALVNDHFAVVGLDTAYHADWKQAYSQGTLTDSNGKSAQLDFLRKIASAAQGRQLILLSHHRGKSLTLDMEFPLWGEVIGAIQGTPSAAKPVYWYWAHTQHGVVYAPIHDKGVTVLPRACGHGALPSTVPTMLQDAESATQRLPWVEWFETRYTAESGPSQPVLNGFGYLELDGDRLTESMVAQTGEVRWRSGP